MSRSIQPAYASNALHLCHDFHFTVPCQQIYDDLASQSLNTGTTQYLTFSHIFIIYSLLIRSSALGNHHLGWNLSWSICQMLPARLQSFHIARTFKCTLALYSDCLHFFFMFPPENLMLMYILLLISHWICSLFCNLIISLRGINIIFSSLPIMEYTHCSIDTTKLIETNPSPWKMMERLHYLWQMIIGTKLR